MVDTNVLRLHESEPKSFYMNKVKMVNTLISFS